MAKRGRPPKNGVTRLNITDDGNPVLNDSHDDPVIVVENQRQKKLQEEPLSQRRVIKDSYKEKRAKRDDSVHFNFGFMPGNSFRCLDCREGFTLFQGADIVCGKCGSTNLVEHSREFVR